MRTSFHYQPEAQHPNSSAIHKPPADYPNFRWKTCSGHHLSLTRLRHARFRIFCGANDHCTHIAGRNFLF